MPDWAVLIGGGMIKHIEEFWNSGAVRRVSTAEDSIEKILAFSRSRSVDDFISRIGWKNQGVAHFCRAPAKVLPDGTGVACYGKYERARKTARRESEPIDHSCLCVINEDGQERFTIFPPAIGEASGTQAGAFTMLGSFPEEGLALGVVVSCGRVEKLCEYDWSTGTLLRMFPLPKCYW